MDENWDLTMQRIVPYINGVNSVRIISILADTDFSLACRAIRHLLYYGCLFLLDIFSFSAIYAPTAQFSTTIACDEAMQQECARYVNTHFATAPNTADISATTAAPNARLDKHNIWPLIGAAPPTDPNTPADQTQQQQHIDGVTIVELYASLKQGQSVKQWYQQHTTQLANIDIRRFITFGIIKGFLYRIHKYPYATGFPAPGALKSATSAHFPFHADPATAAAGVSSRPSSTSSSVADETHLAATGKRASFHSIESIEEEDGAGVDDKTLAKVLDGLHCFDQICTELEVSEKVLTSRLKRFPGEVLILQR